MRGGVRARGRSYVIIEEFKRGGSVSPEKALKRGERGHSET